MNENKTKYYYIIMLALGFVCQILPRVAPLSKGAAVVTLIWIFVFWDLVCRFNDKKKLIITGIVFVVGYTLKFSGSFGNAGFDVVIFGLFGIVIFAVFAISYKLMNRYDKFVGTLIFPAIWTGLYLICTIIRFPTLVRVDMMFANMNLFIQSERIIGSIGFSFAIVWMIALVRYAISSRRARYAFISIVIFFALALPGMIYLYPNTATSQSVRIAYTTGPYVGDFMNYVTLPYEESEASLVKSVEDAVAQNAEMLVFNEEAFEMDDVYEDRFIEKCESLARENNIALLVGLDIADTDGNEGEKSINKIALIGPDGELRNAYQKSMLIPILESGYVSGDKTIPSTWLNLNGKEIKVSYLICYDSNFPGFVRGVDDDTDILLLPSWDWKSITGLHSMLCRMIAVENNIYILKPTYDGISIAVGPDGKVFHSSTTDETGYEYVHVVDMPIKSSVEVQPTHKLTTLEHAIIATEIFSILVCIILFAGTILLSTEKTRRSWLFGLMLISNAVACGADALSWALDGHVNLSVVVYASSMVSSVLTFIIFMVFLFYLLEYVRERTQARALPVFISAGFALLGSIVTVIMSLNGSLFTVENAVYADGPFYTVYLVMNAGIMLYAVGAITYYRKSLSVTDRIVAYVYMLIPVASAVINMFFEEWSFAYPAMTLSMLIVYVMIQTDRVGRLETEGKIVNFYATHDTLTGLLNRRAYEECRTAIMRVEGTSGIVFADLNGLKFANDNFGHEAGDQLLVNFASILSELFRANEIFRISGDEFICMMENVDEHIFKDRLNALENVINKDEQPIACMGAAFGKNSDIDELFKEAESKMYEQKDIFHARFPKLVR